MKNNYISYYELLTMIKERNIPPKITLHLVQDKSVEYISTYDYINSEFIGYEILNDKEADENYHYHLGDCFLESTMFDKCIEIERCNNYFEYIEEINYYPIRKNEIAVDYVENNETKHFCLNKKEKYFADKINQLIKNQNKIIEILKEEQ